MNYSDWLEKARANTGSKYELGNELRDHWDDWKSESQYSSWDECLQAELELTATALRTWNGRQRRKNSSNGTKRDTAQKTPPRRNQRNGQADNDNELARRRAQAVKLYKQGYTLQQIADALGGISPNTVKMDLLASGVDVTRRPKYKTKKEAPEGSYVWKDEDTDEEPPEEFKPSKVVNEDTAACDIRPASELIDRLQEEVGHFELDLWEIDNRYDLGSKDRARFIEALEKLISLSQEAIDSVTNKGSHHSSAPS